MKTPEEETLEELLGLIRRRFYSDNGSDDTGANLQQRPGKGHRQQSDKTWHRDRQALIRALTWPAQWLSERGLSIGQQRYRQLIEERLCAIAAHGDPARRRAYFPTYLLKCLQDYFAHRGEDLYDELKHIRNALCGLEIRLNIRHTQSEQASQTDTLARTHRLLTVKAKARRKPSCRPPEQLELF